MANNSGKPSLLERAAGLIKTGEKVMGKIKLPKNFVLIALIITTCISSGGLFFTHKNYKSYQQRTEQVYEEFEQNKSIVAELQQKLDSLEDIQSRYDTLKKSYDDLQTANKTLQDKYSELENNNKTLQTAYDDLKKSYDELSNNYNTLKSKADTLAPNTASQTNPSTNSTSTSGVTASSGVQASSQTSSYTVYRTKTGEKYHRSGCRHLSKSQIAISIEDARAMGLTPCKVCNP